MEDIDRLPLGIYKSIMNRTYQRLNNKILYVDERVNYLPFVLKATEMYSPLHNTDYNEEEIRMRNETRKYNKEFRLTTEETFLIDYLKSLEDGI